MDKSRWALRREGLARIKVRRGCFVCGWDDYASGLDFHHYSGRKGGTISSMIRSPYDEIVRELRKTVVCCSLCHRGIHSGDVEPTFKKGLGVRLSEQEIQWIK